MRKDVLAALRAELGLILANLVRAYAQGPDYWVALERLKNRFYGADDRYNCLKIRRSIVNAVDALKALGFLEVVGGFQNPKTGKGYVSRFKATPALIDLLPPDAFVASLQSTGEPSWDEDADSSYEAPRLDPAWVKQVAPQLRSRECIILKKGVPGTDRKERVGYEDTEETNLMRANLTAYNALMDRTEISLPGYPLKIDPTQTLTSRVFGNGSFEDGGRFYGPWWCGVKSEARVALRINGKATTEIDYKAFHPTVICVLAGKDPNGPEAFDPYVIPGYSQEPTMREIMKLAVLIGLNSKSASGAATALRGRIKEEGHEEWFKQSGLEAKLLLSDYAEARPEVAKHFYTSAWTWLQRLDSDVAEGIMNHFTAKGVPLLMLHDSFIVEESRAGQLEEVMIREFRRALVGRAGMSPSYAATVSPKLKVEIGSALDQKTIAKVLDRECKRQPFGRTNKGRWGRR